MKKALKIIAIASGIISTVSAFILGCIYLDDLAKSVKKTATGIAGKLMHKINLQKFLGEDQDCE